MLAVLWLSRIMLEPESSKTLILCHLSDMTRMAFQRGTRSAVDLVCILFAWGQGLVSHKLFSFS